MIPTVWATVKDGKIELLEAMSLPEGSRVLVTLVPSEEDAEFWQRASEVSLSKVWGNPQDDHYAREAYPLMDTVARQEGWDDPEMDSYDIYARKPQT